MEQLHETGEDLEMQEEGSLEMLPEEDLEIKDEKKRKLKKKEKTKEKAKTQQELALEQSKRELEQVSDQYLRLRAEYDNYRKRSVAEKAAVYNNGVSDAIAAVLPVMDNMERALSQKDAKSEDLQKGMDMIHHQFRQAFEKLTVTALGELGETFDPNLHNAVSHVEDESLPDGVITQVLQKGYMVGKKVIRHAMVEVAN